jgi:thiamine transport system permease protein
VDGDRPPLSGSAPRLLLAAVPLAFGALFFLYPLGAILARGLGAGAGGLEVPLDVLTARSTWQVAWFTLWQAAASTALTLAAGIPVAWALARFDFRGRRLAQALVVVPFVLPTVVVASAFLALLPDGVERTPWAILLAHVFFNVAVVVRVVGSFWEGLGNGPWDAAATLGAGPVRRAREVTLPLLGPALAAAGAITFLFCFTSFGIVVILGGPRYRTLEAAIYDQAVRFFDLQAAAVLAIIQLVAVAAVLLVSGRLEARLGGARSRSTESRRRPNARERGTLAAVLAAAAVFLGAPLAVLAERSLRVADGHGLANFRALAEETPALLVAPWQTAVNSLLYALAATAIALVVGLLTAAVVVRRRRGAGSIDALVMLPLGASAAMLGFGFVIAFDEPPLELRGSWWIVPIAQALVATPFAVRIIAPSWRAVDERLREAAAVLGASPRQVFREIDLPLLLRAAGVAAGLAFAVALGEFGATVFVAPGDRPTLTVAIFRFLGRPGAENAGLAAALCVVLMGLTAAAVLLAERAATGRRSI